MQVKKEITDCDLEIEVVRLSTSNTNINYGGLLRRSKENVLIKIKSELTTNIFDFGCSVHIIHNYSNIDVNYMPLGMEVLMGWMDGWERPKHVAIKIYKTYQLLRMTVPISHKY
jgi:hypothetical protein